MLRVAFLRPGITYTLLFQQLCKHVSLAIIIESGDHNSQ